MRDFTVMEVSEFVGDFFEKVRTRDYNSSSIEAATRCFYEYEPIMDDGITEKIVFTLYIMESMLKVDRRIYIGQHDLISDAIEKVLGGGVELDLSVEEKEKIILLANKLKEQLSQMEIIYDPNER
ncbi:Imm3 family immunity protein [Paenibacillus motobuensis]|uniref:Immunity protein Imm3 n=1 Tax=Paenibacillus motobuensis TaxID=295324 RepID=A0ABN0YPM4_9BACL